MGFHAVEAHHAAWIRDINRNPAGARLRHGAEMKQVLTAVAKTKFIVAWARAVSPAWSSRPVSLPVA